MSKAEYNRLMDELSNDLSSSSVDIAEGSLQPNEIQVRLDQIAKKYQHDESIGPERYRLYETQALIYYYSNNDPMALDFIDQAVEMRGEDYAIAKSVREGINLTPALATSSAPKNNKSNFSGIIGIVAFIVIGLLVSFGVNAVIDANADAHINEVLDVCTVDPSSSDCSTIKEKYDAKVECDTTSCNASVPVTHWYIIPIKSH